MFLFFSLTSLERRNENRFEFVAGVAIVRYNVRRKYQNEKKPTDKGEKLQIHKAKEIILIQF